MKQRIREMLHPPAPGGYNPKREESGSQWRSPGDTYERYTQRCQRMQIEPKNFQEWLAFEITVAEPQRRWGGHAAPRVDDHQRQFQAG